MIKKIHNFKLKTPTFQSESRPKSVGFENLQKGMTYTELIVVLSIFSIMSTITIFSYGDFQAKVDIKNLANDLASKFVEAQKSSAFGQFPSAAQQVGLSSNWKPAYGIYINLSSDNKSFIYFADLDNSNSFDGTDCTNECVEKISITKGNFISRIDVLYQDSSTTSLNNLTVNFTRPDNAAKVSSIPALAPNISYVQITVSTAKSLIAKIKIYPSGRIQIN